MYSLNKNYFYNHRVIQRKGDTTANVPGNQTPRFSNYTQEKCVCGKEKENIHPVGPYTFISQRYKWPPSHNHC